jgi:chromate transporter
LDPTLVNLARTFALISLTAFGGGQMTSMRREMVRRLGWLSDEEFVEMLSLLPTMPGPNPVSMAVLVGFKFRGVAGSAVSLFACIIPAFVMLMLIAKIYLSQPSGSILYAMFRGCAAGVVGINVANAFELTAPYLRIPLALLFIAATAYLVSGLHFSLELVLVILAPLSIGLRAWRGKL